MTYQGQVIRPKSRRWLRRIIGIVLVIIGIIVMYNGYKSSDNHWLDPDNPHNLKLDLVSIIGGAITAAGVAQLGGGIREISRHLPR